MWTGEGESKVLYVQTHGVERSRAVRYAVLPRGVRSGDGRRGDDLLHHVRADPAAALTSSTRSARKVIAASRFPYFIEQATGLGVRLLVCQPSLDLNDLAIDDLIDGVEMIGGAAFNDLALNADAVISF